MQIKQKSDNKKEKHQFGDYWLIQNQILQTNTIPIVLLIVRRMNTEILGVKGFKRQNNEATFIPR